MFGGDLDWYILICLIGEKNVGEEEEEKFQILRCLLFCFASKSTQLS